MRSPYQKTIDYLYQLRLFGTKMGLDNTLQLAAAAGNPHQRLRFIHVAGTNGKGSTCALLESACRAASLKTGLFTSPHLVSFTERIQVNRCPIPEEDVTRLGDRLRDRLRHFPAEQHPTFFEVVTVMALIYFLEQQCDIILWETGLGGRLDATNIVTPLASVITNIQFDHVRWLGSTLADIAAEKAGIIKPAIPVVTGENNPEPLAVIERRAAALRAPLVRVLPEDLQSPPLDRLRLNLLGEHQRWNAAVALATLETLRPILHVGEAPIRKGFESVQWSGRLQLVNVAPDKLWLLDGAHNPAGAGALRDACDALFPEKKPAVLLGLLSDKDWPAMCQTIVPFAGQLLLAPIASDRSADPNQIARFCREICPSLDVAIYPSLSEAITAALIHPFVLVTGSLYFIGETMELLGITAAGSRHERQLNDWNAAAS